jgi:hypothetical protein
MWLGPDHASVAQLPGCPREVGATLADLLFGRFDELDGAAADGRQEPQGPWPKYGQSLSSTAVFAEIALLRCGADSIRR